MVRALVPRPVDPKSAGRDFWSRFHELRRIRQAEERPDEPLEPDANVEFDMKRDDPFMSRYWYELTRDGRMVSWLFVETVKPENPEYATNKHLMWADAYVRLEQRRERVASLWLAVIAELMDRHGCTVLGIQAAGDPGHRFLEWLGAKPKLTNVVSRLRFSEVDWTMLERWAADGTARSPQTRLDVYDGGPPESMWEELAPQFTAMFNTMPLEELDLGDIIFTPERFRDWAERRAQAGVILHSVMTREPDGSISGLTDTTWASYRPTVIHQEFTGVRTDARGRGLGKWVKAAMLLHIREVHPEVESVITDNAQSNGPMLNINRTMGFKAYRAEVDYQMSRAELAARLASL